MKTKKIVFSIIAVVLLVALFGCLLTACLKIGMKEKNVIDRLKKHGAEVSYERSSPVIADWQSNGVSIKDILLAVMQDGDNAVDGATLDVDTDESENENKQILYIFYANDKPSADWIEKKCKEYKETNAETCKNWNVYRYDNVVMIGDYQLLAVARQY